MPSTTISLERSAYELLRSKKRPKESFSKELIRLLGAPKADLQGFLDVVPTSSGKAIADAIEELRAEDLRTTQRAGGARAH